MGRAASFVVVAAMAVAASGCVLHAPDKHPPDGDADVDTGADPGGDDWTVDPGGDDWTVDTDGTDPGDTVDVEEEEGPPPLDMDGDTIPDVDEGCGPETPDSNDDTVVNDLDWTDTDGDGTPDCEDLDSDGDCLPDDQERLAGTSAQSMDTDTDGACDLMEVAVGTDPLDATDNPSANGDHAFLMRYEADPEPLVGHLVMDTAIQKVDVFFLVDTTGSMGGEIANLKANLTGTLVPGIAALVPDPIYGVGHFDDYPVSPYGDAGSGDVVFQLMSAVSPSASTAQSALNVLNTHMGGDVPESAIPALWATATGNGMGTYLAAQTSCGSGMEGYPCFRPDSMPLIAMVTDAPFHNGPGDTDMYSGVSPPPPVFAEAMTALNSIAAKFVAVVTDEAASGSLEDCEQVARETFTVNGSTGDPLVVIGATSGTDTSTQVLEAIETVMTEMEIESTLHLVDDPADTVDAVAEFVDRFEPSALGGYEAPEDPGTVCVGGLPVADSDSDTIVDFFTGVLPGTIVCFDLHLKQNTTLAGAATPIAYHAQAVAVGYWKYFLSSRDLYFVVPPPGCVP